MKNSLLDLLIPGRRKRHTTRTTQINAKVSGWWADLSERADRLVFSWKIREGLYTHLEFNVDNNLDIQIALETFTKRLERRNKLSAKKIIERIILQMSGAGASFAGAMSKWIPLDEAAAIDAGEVSDRIPIALRALIQTKRRTVHVRRAFRKALAQPLTYFASVYAFLWVFGMYGSSSLIQAVPRSRATGIGATLYTLSDLATSWAAILPIALIVLGFPLLLWSFQNWTGRLRILAEKYQPFTFYRDMQGFLWMSGYASLLSARKADTLILISQLKYASPWLRERIEHFFERMERHGDSFPMALLRPKFDGWSSFEFPNPDVVDNIESMYGRGRFAEQISEVLDRWAQDIQQAADDLAIKVNGVGQLVTYIVIIYIVLASNSLINQVATIRGI